MKTPNADIENGALRGGGAPSLLSRETFGLLAQYWTVGWVLGTLPGTVYPFLQIYLNMEGSQTLSARVLMTMAWSFKVYMGIISDCFPIAGRRRRPYILLGWTMCFVMLLVMGVMPVGEPYFPKPEWRQIKPENYLKEGVNESLLNKDAQDQGGKYVVIMMMAAYGYVLSNVCADAVVVEFAQREPEAIRGRTQTAIYTVRTFSVMLSYLITAFVFNGKDFGGQFEFTLTFPQLMLALAVLCFPVLPITWFFLSEEPYTPPRFVDYMKEFWTVLQKRAIYQIIAYKFFAGLFESFTFTAEGPMQVFWAGVKPLNEKLASVVVLGVMVVTLYFTGKYGLHWNWRTITIVTLMTGLVLDALCVVLTTYDIVRNEWFWLGLPIVEQLPNTIGFVVSTYVVVELADVGNEGAIYGLITTVSNLSSPFAGTISKNVNAPFNITNERIQNDKPDVRRDIMITVVIMYAMRLLSLAWLPLLPPQKKETQALKAKGGSSKWMGLFTVTYVLFAQFWSVMTNLMSLFKSTKCLKIAGGQGC